MNEEGELNSSTLPLSQARSLSLSLSFLRVSAAISSLAQARRNRSTATSGRAPMRTGSPIIPVPRDT